MGDKTKKTIRPKRSEIRETRIALENVYRVFMRFGNRRMTKTERAAFVNVSGQQAWQTFRARLEAASTLEQALEVVALNPTHTAAGSGLYANLAAFLKDYRIPKRAIPAERVLYADLVRRLRASGEIPADRADALIEALLKF
jgi:hypothetical protein